MKEISSVVYPRSTVLSFWRKFQYTLSLFASVEMLPVTIGLLTTHSASETVISVVWFWPGVYEYMPENCPLNRMYRIKISPAGD